jgi:hypothetical protein
MSAIAIQSVLPFGQSRIHFAFETVAPAGDQCSMPGHAAMAGLARVSRLLHPHACGPFDEKETPSLCDH